MRFTPFPIIETQRLTLRRMQETDLFDLFAMRQEPSMIAYVDSKLDNSIEDTIVYINKMNKGMDDDKWIIWAIESKQSNKLIGTISIWNINQNTGELGYGIIPEFQGQGLMQEALHMVIQYAFTELSLFVLEAYTEENNFKSIQLLKKCNFSESKRVDDVGSDRVYHMIVYSLTNSVLT